MQTLLKSLNTQSSEVKEGLRDLIGQISQMDWSYNSWINGGSAHWCSKVYEDDGLNGLGLTIEIHHTQGILVRGSQPIGHPFLRVSMYDLQERGGHVSTTVRKFNKDFQGRLSIWLASPADYQEALNLLRDIQQYKG